jgi:hypothetical protein
LSTPLETEIGVSLTLFFSSFLVKENSPHYGPPPRFHPDYADLL